jgi:hypothetical protein
MSFLISNQRSITKQLQYVFEDSKTTAGNWGTTPATPTFTQAGYSPAFTYTDQPEGVDVRQLGTEGKITRVKTGMSGLLDIRTTIVDSALAKWFFNAATIARVTAGIIDDSATFLYTHSVLGVDTYRIMKGCIPLNATLDVPHRGLIELSGQILVTQPEDEAPFANISNSINGTPTYAPAVTGPPWTHLSGGTQPLTIGNSNYRDRGMRVSITRELSLLDSSGDVNVLFARASRKTITGTITAFRIDSLNQAAASALTEFAGTTTRVLKTATSTITFTNLQFQDHPTNYSDDSSDALMEELTFACTEIAIS